MGMTMKTVLFSGASAVVGLLAYQAAAEVSSVSAEAAVDTRLTSKVASVDQSVVDSRSYTVNWSLPRHLNTKKTGGTLVLLK